MGEEREPGPRILVLEDDLDVATLLVEILIGEGFDARRADHHTPVEVIARERPRVLLLDLCLGPKSGGEVLGELRRSGLSDVPVVLLSGKPDLESHARALGAAATVNKPFEIDALVSTCRSLAG